MKRVYFTPEMDGFYGAYFENPGKSENRYRRGVYHRNAGRRVRILTGSCPGLSEYGRRGVYDGKDKA